jgi:hypothetical protein
VRHQLPSTEAKTDCRKLAPCQCSRAAVLWLEAAACRWVLVAVSVRNAGAYDAQVGIPLALGGEVMAAFLAFSLSRRLAGMRLNWPGLVCEHPAQEG